MNKQDLTQIEQLFRKVIKEETKDFITSNDLQRELKVLPTRGEFRVLKDGLRSIRDQFPVLEMKMKYEIDEAVGQIIGAVEHAKADREEVSEIDLRVTKIEKTLELR